MRNQRAVNVRTLTGDIGHYRGGRYRTHDRLQREKERVRKYPDARCKQPGRRNQTPYRAEVGLCHNEWLDGAKRWAQSFLAGEWRCEMIDDSAERQRCKKRLNALRDDRN